MSLNQNILVPVDKVWTNPEKWIWEQVSTGHVADFNSKYQQLDPTDKETWTEERSVSPGFIETVLLLDPYRASLPRRGLRISGAWIKEKLDLNNARLETEWSIENSRVDSLVDLSFLQTTNLISFGGSVFEQSLDLTCAEIGTILDLNKAEFQKITMMGAKVGGQLNMSGTKVKDALNMDSLSVGGSLFMSEKSEFQNVILRAANISGALDLDGAKVKDKLEMDQLSVGAALFMRRAEFQEIVLRSAKITGQLDLTGTKVKGKLNMDQLSVGSSLIMCKAAEFQEIALGSAKIYGLIDMTEIKVKGKLDMDQLSAGSSLLMSKAAEFQEIVLRGAKIGGQLQMIESKIEGKLYLDSLEVANHLHMSKSEFKDIDLRSSKIGGQLDMTGIKVRGKLDMNQLSVGSSLFMNTGAEFQEIILQGAKITGRLLMTDSKVEGKANMDSITVGEHLQMTKSDFQDINLQSAKIGGLLDVIGIKVKEKLEMNSISVGSHLSMNETDIRDVGMITANVHGQLNTTDATVTGILEMDSASVDQNIFLFPKLIGHVNLQAANIGQSVYISRGEISTLDFSGACIRGELHIGMYHTKRSWTQNSMLRLRNTQVGAIDDGGEEDSWPDELDLDGFAYSRLGGLFDQNSVGQTRSIKDRSAKWFIDWLAKEKNYSPQPYSQLASVLTAMGHSEMANTLLYASKNRERKEAWASGQKMKWFGYSLLNWTIGYGFGARYFRSLIWILALTLIGVYVLSTTEVNAFPSFWDKISFSLDMLLPIIELNDKYKLDKFEHWQLYYFYFHKLMGFLLGSFIVAGLSGITKK